MKDKIINKIEAKIASKQTEINDINAQMTKLHEKRNDLTRTCEVLKDEILTIEKDIFYDNLSFPDIKWLFKKQKKGYYIIRPCFSVDVEDWGVWLVETLNHHNEMFRNISFNDYIWLELTGKRIHIRVNTQKDEDESVNDLLAQDLLFEFINKYKLNILDDSIINLCEKIDNVKKITKLSKKITATQIFSFTGTFKEKVEGQKRRIRNAIAREKYQKERRKRERDLNMFSMMSDYLTGDDKKRLYELLTTKEYSWMRDKLQKKYKRLL